MTINGRDFYLGHHGTQTSRDAYDRILQEWLKSGRSPTYGRPASRTTIVELLVAFLAHAKDYYGESPRGEYRNLVVAALRPLK